jgi:hypothetical protein
MSAGHWCARIYPMEINPHIPLNSAVKECPLESWEKGPELIVGGELVDQELAGLIERSRQADRDDIPYKDAICALLGIRTTALKGDGFTAYLPDMTELATIIDELTGQTLPEWSGEWLFHVSGDDIAEQVLAAGAHRMADEPVNYAFISLRVA